MVERHMQLSGLPVRVRFEQRNGHYCVIEGTDDHPLTMIRCDAFQLRMLAANSVPGLLKLEVEQWDGCLSLRYALSGTRMLSQVLRLQKWTMAAMMGAVNRMAEVLENCRLYVLDPLNLLLEPDRIFLGEQGESDVRFIYLPASSPAGSLADKLESILIRWMMHTDNLDGTAVQRMLQMIASPDFKPADLVHFTRRYLANLSTGGGVDSVPVQAAPTGMVAASTGMDAGSRAAELEHPAAMAPDADASGDTKGQAAGWRWFEPSAADAQGVSALLGNEPEPFGTVPDEPEQPHDEGARRNVWLACAAITLIAVAWRWGYMAFPGWAGLVVSAAATIMVLGASIVLWLAGSRREKRTASPPDRLSVDRGLDQAAASVMPERNHLADKPLSPIFTSPRNSHAAIPGNGHTDIPGNRHAVVIPGDRFAVIPEERQADMPAMTVRQTRPHHWETERTQQLDMHASSPHSASFYLDWETATTPDRQIPLQANAIVIGRSQAASTHVDETPGISRAHLEVRKTDAGWTATDLGSRNGSKLNGEPMVAYEPYLLKPEDCLELVGSRYRLKQG